MNIAYSDLLNLRRQFEIRDGVGPVLQYETSISGYHLEMVANGVLYTAEATGADATDFEDNRMGYANKINWPTPDQVNSHNFCDDTDWVESPSSLYCFAPTTGKRARLTQINGILDKGVDLWGAKYLQMTSWFSIDGTACPAFAPGTPTAFGSPLFDPGGGVYTGWLKQQYDSKQDYATWIHLTNGVPDYGLRHYVWDSLTVLKLRAGDFRQIDNSLNLFYSFFGNNDYFELRSSLNERLEVWIETDTALSSPNGVGCRFAVYFSLYDEW